MPFRMRSKTIGERSVCSFIDLVVLMKVRIDRREQMETTSGGHFEYKAKYRGACDPEHCS